MDNAQLAIYEGLVQANDDAHKAAVDACSTQRHYLKLLEYRVASTQLCAIVPALIAEVRRLKEQVGTDDLNHG